jgi:hypothetical protein
LKGGFETWVGDVTVAEGQQLTGQNIILKPTDDSQAPVPPKNVKVIKGK